MEILWHASSLEHDTGAHPESAQRLKCLGPLKETDVEFNESVMALVHDLDYIEKVKEHF